MESGIAKVDIRIGTLDDVADGVSIYEYSNLARRHGQWTSRAFRVEQVTKQLKEAADASASWFLMGYDNGEAVAMALCSPYRGGDGSSQIMQGIWFLNLIYVLSDRWGKGIGGTMLDAVINESARRSGHQIYLWTHEYHNERAHGLYRSRRFAPTGRIIDGDTDEPSGEWLLNF